MDNTKFERLIAEICKNGNLTYYESILRKIITKILSSGCLISICYHTNYSISEQNQVENTKRIRVSLNKEKPIHIIWDILHEFGHIVSGIKSCNDNTLERESKAWLYAQQEILNYEQLIYEIDDFENYMNKCLKSYNK